MHRFQEVDGLGIESGGSGTPVPQAVAVLAINPHYRWALTGGPGRSSCLGLEPGLTVWGRGGGRAGVSMLSPMRALADSGFTGLLPMFHRGSGGPRRI